MEKANYCYCAEEQAEERALQADKICGVFIFFSKERSGELSLFPFFSFPGSGGGCDGDVGQDQRSPGVSFPK